MSNHTNTTAPTSAPTLSPSASPKTRLQCKQTNVDGWNVNVASLAGAGFPQRSVCKKSDFVVETAALFPYFEQTKDLCYSETHSCLSASFNYSGSDTPYYLAFGCVTDAPAELALLKLNVANFCLSVEACKNFNQNGTGLPAGGYETCKTNGECV